MDRDVFKKLISWKNQSKRKPLLVRGARQVGKTFTIQTFGKMEFEQVFTLNFDERPNLKIFFQGDLNPKRIIRDLGIHFEKEILPGKHLLFLDEIQECPEALNSLKYFQEQAPEFHLIGAGSLLGVKLDHTKGFPVGKVEFLDMFPLSFLEFLDAVGKKKLKEMIETKSQPDPLLEPFHLELISFLKFYLIVGGMPEAVAQFVSNQNDLQTIRKIQKSILDAYVLDFAKHAPPSQVMKITTLWNTIPSQLAKENKKFIFSVIHENARAREYEEAFQWLEDAGLIIKAYRITTPKIPLEAYVDSKAFRVFHLDVGLLGSMSHLPPTAILEGNQVFMEFKGALTENFVAQELTTLFHKRLYYWTSGADAEVDFVIPTDTEFYPLEVKSGENKRKKSLLVFSEKYHPSLILRASPMNFHQDGTFLNIPLYHLVPYLKKLTH